jgi:hypothetical protein
MEENLLFALQQTYLFKNPPETNEKCSHELNVSYFLFRDFTDGSNKSIFYSLGIRLSPLFLNPPPNHKNSSPNAHLAASALCNANIDFIARE